MTRIRAALVVAALSIVGAHALAFALIQLLPDPAVLLLGLFSVQTAATDAVRESYSLPDFLTVWRGLLVGDLGETIDKTSVAAEIARALVHSLPRFIIALVAAVAVAISFTWWGTPRHSVTSMIAGLIVFLPPFVFPMAVVAIFLSLYAFYDLASWSALAWVGCTVSIAIGPICLSFLQARLVLRGQLSSQYVTRMYAYGANDRDIRRSIVKNVMLELLPSFEKMVTMLLTILIFAEFIFGVPGLGVQTIRAVIRADWAMVLGIVLLFAFLINTSRFVSVCLNNYIKAR